MFQYSQLSVHLVQSLKRSVTAVECSCLPLVPLTSCSFLSLNSDETVHKTFCICNVAHTLCIDNLCEKHSSPLHRDATNCDVINQYYDVITDDCITNASTCTVM